MTEITAISIMLISTIVSAFASLYLKRGSKSDRILDIIKNNDIKIGLFLFVIGASLVIVALKFDELSAVFPIASLTYVWAVFLSSKFLGEKIKTWKIVGLLFVVAGVILITL